MRFLYYDHIKTIEKGRRIVAVKTFPLSEGYLGMHFSRRPAIPGVILIEAMAQAIGWLAVYSHDFEFSAILSMVEGVEVPASLDPGATAEIHGEIVSTTPRDTLASGRVLVDGKEVASVKRIIFAHFRGASKRETKRRFAYYGGFRGEHIPASATGDPAPAEDSAPRRVVVTGMGLATPLGVGVARNWRRALGGETPGGEQPTAFAGQVSEEDWEEMVARLPGVSAEAERRQVLALQAAEEAMLQARLVSEVPLGERSGVALASDRRAAESAPPHHADDGAVARELAKRFGLRGPQRNVAQASLAFGEALAAACRAIREGEADAMLVGATLDEGAGIAVVESEGHAVERGARICAEVAGCVSTSKVHSAKPENALSHALETFGIAPEDVGCVIALGTGASPEVFARNPAVKAAFGEHAEKLATRCVAAPLGSSATACEVAEFVFASQAMFRGQAPVAHGSASTGASDGDTGQPQTADMRAAMIWSVGPEGQETAIVLKRHEP